MPNADFYIIMVFMMGLEIALFTGILIMLFIFKGEYNEWKKSIADIKQSIIEVNVIFNNLKTKK